ncbi:sugar transferase [Candidatus Saccharibacteria bacterium]|nr:sugar transferase [Candidatus Saccharibacteria bacterium]
MKNNASLVYALFLVVGDFLALVAAFTSAYILRVKFDPRPLIAQIPALTFLYAFLVILPVWIFINAFLGLYNHEIYEKRFVEIGKLLVSSFLGILAFIGYDFVSNEALFPARLVPVYGLFLGFTYLLIFRTLARFIRHLLFRYGIGISNILLVGDTDATSEIAHSMSNTKRTGLKIIGTVGRRVHKIPSFQDFTDALEKLKEKPHGVIQTELFKNQDKNNEIIRLCQLNHMSYRFIPGNSDMFVGNIEVELFADRPVIAVHQTSLIGWGKVIKRLFDLFISILIVIVTSPIMLIVAIMLKLSDPKAPVFFRQTRLTRFNREFMVFKFRTHRADISGLSDKEAFEKIGKPELYEKYKANGYSLNKDPRISKIGNFLRRTSLDELPQLFNVLIGDLSLVGPRTLIAAELNTYERKHDILSVKAGITGLAQISGREDISFDERRKLDIYYVQNWSFWLDITILVRTLRAVITGTGAK